MLVKNGLSVFVEIQSIYISYENSTWYFTYFFNIRRISR